MSLGVKFDLKGGVRNQYRVLAEVFFFCRLVKFLLGFGVLGFRGLGV